MSATTSSSSSSPSKEPSQKIVQYKNYKCLLIEKRERVLSVKFNRPQVRNALDRKTYYELIRVLDIVSKDNNITIVALSGVGEAFSAGLDIRQISDYNASDYARTSNVILLYLIKAFIKCPKILVAVVNGASIGLGFTITALCDVVYCTTTAYFQTPFTKLGLCPEACSSYMFPLIFGRAKASELLLFGTKLTPAEAQKYNFVAGIYEPNEVESILWPQLQQFSNLPQESLRVTKQLICTSPLYKDMFVAIKQECSELAKLRSGDAFQNAIQLFLNRSKANKSKL